MRGLSLAQRQHHAPDAAALVLPHSGERYFGSSDWGRLRAALRVLVARAPRGGGAGPTRAASGTYQLAAPAAAAAGARVEHGMTLVKRLGALRRALHAAETSPRVALRAIAYLGRLLTGGAGDVVNVPLKQASRTQQAHWAAAMAASGAGAKAADVSTGVQAVLDVWAVGCVSLPTGSRQLRAL